MTVLPTNTTNGVAVWQPTPQTSSWVDLVAPAAELAAKIAGTDFVPKAFRGNPAAVAACILYGAEIGLGPMQSLAKVDIVEGRPAPKAELARALLLAAGHDMWIEDMTNTKVTVAGRRRNSDVTQRVSWTMDDAKKAGLATKQMYTKYPRQMLAARASAELARLVAPDALGGIAYFAEELDDDTPPSIPAASGPADTPQDAPAGTTKRRRTQTPAVAPTPVEDVPLLPDELELDPKLAASVFGSDHPDEPVEAMTDAQKKKMLALFNNLDIRDRADRLTLCSGIVGGQIGSANDLTKTEASRIIDTLTQIERNEATITWDDDGQLTLVEAGQP